MMCFQFVIFKFFMLLLIIFLHNHNYYGVNGDPQVECFFIFGDSLSDSGNNNNLKTFSKANYKPYGIDFPKATPTGRFTNGQTVVDILGQLLGFDEFIPPFANTTGYDILKGVNYASGSAGILPQSGKYLGDCISLNKQVDNHQITISKIKNRVKNDYLKKCLYHITIGTNDYIANYLLPKFYNTSHLYTPQQYAELLIQKYEDQILRLYSNSSARKVALVGLGQLGSTPAVIALYGINGITKVNQKVQLFNQNLISLVHKLNTKFSDAKFIYVNNYGIQSGDLSSLGLTNVSESCCETNNIGLCIPSSTTCDNRTSYVFWDEFHTTETLNKFTANRSYTSLHASDNYPIDIKHLAQLQF
ncbi:GDSL esterase/lipase At1g29660 isoform X2 [Cannabis sativa]|uniref:GDSL esterase/lipase At1g29660 isoform X2 n=1 Tax=Cannabis sativa TaxID=3483 RepID=UPI0029CA2F60|nr:GDSL esterase/lipase At1g29660 isoform X2 [Cannabis sativa]